MKWIWKAVKLLLVTVLLVTAIRRFDLVRDSRGTVTIVLDGMALSAAEAEAICQNEAEQDESLSVCFFGEQTVQVTCEENGKNASVTLILAAGNPTLLAKGGTALNWLEDGCLLDQNTASSIFGTSQTSGQYLWISGEAYQVCGTFESEMPAVIRNAAASDENALTQAVLKASSQDKDNLSGKAEQFLTRHTLSGTVISMDHLIVFVGDLLLLVPLILLGRLTETIIRGKNLWFRKKEGGFVREDAVLLFFFTFVTFWLAFHYFEIPSDMIPTRWSDFSFWGTWLDEQKKNLLLLLTTPLGKVQAQVLWNCRISLSATLAAAFLAFL